MLKRLIKLLYFIWRLIFIISISSFTIFLFTILLITCCFQTCISLRKFNKEIFFLQPIDASLYTHTFKSFFLNKEMPKINLKIDSHNIVFFATPNCTTCYSELETLIDLQERHGKVPLKVFLPSDDEQSFKFINKYKNIVDMELIDFSQTTNTIAGFPAIMVIEKNTNVIAVDLNPLFAYNIIKNKLIMEDQKNGRH